MRSTASMVHFRFLSQGAITAGAATLISLLLVEVTLRTAGFDPLADVRAGREILLRPSVNADVQYELAPGASGWAWGTQVAVNSAGFRGPEVSPVKHVYRIEVLGDSIAFANFIPSGMEFPAQLGRLLDGRAEVLNLAVGGYDVIQEVALFETKGLQHDPDLVVLAYCLNDAGVVSANSEYVHRLRRYAANPLSMFRTFQFVMTRIDRVRMGAFQQWANEPAVFREHYRDRIDPIGAEPDLRVLMREAGAIGRLPSTWYESEDRVGRVRWAFRRLHSLVAGNGGRVLVLIVPWLEQEGGAYPYQAVHAIVRYEAERASFDVLDLTAVFMTRGLESLRLSATDAFHPNQEGHRIIAQTLASFVSRTIQPN